VSWTYHFVRHAAHDNVGGYLAGRLHGVHLGPAGLAQATRLAQRMQREQFTRIYASPQERTQQTAMALATRSGLQHETSADLDEVNFGSWSGLDFVTLGQDAEWQRWNAARSLGQTPAGETMLDVQTRVLSLMRRIAESEASSSVVLVSHADVIKAAIAYHLGISLDRLGAIDIAPASLSILRIDGWHAQLILLNERADLYEAEAG
jgi:broad specificity phosphatase PhoE